MKLLNKVFYETKMTWLKVFVFAIITSVFAALLNCIPILQRTSLSAPAETHEFWILCAIFIIFNCHGYIEAMAKTFIFFLFGQPLIYLIEVPFKADGWGLFRYYPAWFVITILTIPGAALCYRAKKEGIISGIIMSLAIILDLGCAFSRINVLVHEFPRYLLTLIFCVGTTVIYILILKDKKARFTALIIALVFTVGYFVYKANNPDYALTSYPIEGSGNWTVESVSDDDLIVEIDGSSIVFKSAVEGDYTVVIVNDQGDKITYILDSDMGRGVIDVHRLE